MRGFLTFAVIVIGFLYYYFAIYNNFNWNTRITVEIETPDGVVSGTTVLRHQVVYRDNPVMGVNQLSYNKFGEAAVIPIGDHGAVFVTTRLSIFWIQNVLRENFPDQFPGTSQKKWLHILTGLSGAFDISTDNPPDLAYLPDKRELFGFTEITAENIVDVLGEGYAFHKITLEFTNDPVTYGHVEAFLGADYIERREELVAKIWEADRNLIEEWGRYDVRIFDIVLISGQN